MKKHRTPKPQRRFTTMPAPFAFLPTEQINIDTGFIFLITLFRCFLLSAGLLIIKKSSSWLILFLKNCIASYTYIDRVEFVRKIAVLNSGGILDISLGGEVRPGPSNHDPV